MNPTTALVVAVAVVTGIYGGLIAMLMRPHAHTRPRARAGAKHQEA